MAGSIEGHLLVRAIFVVPFLLDENKSQLLTFSKGDSYRTDFDMLAQLMLFFTELVP